MYVHAASARVQHASVCIVRDPRLGGSSMVPSQQHSNDNIPWHGGLHYVRLKLRNRIVLVGLLP